MATHAKPIEIVEIPDDDDDHIPVSVPGDPSKKPAVGGNKDDAIPVESYCQSMENRDFALAIMSSIFPKSSRNPKKRVFIDLSREIEDTPDDDIQVLDSFTIKNGNSRRKRALNSNFELGESSNAQSGSFVCEICIDEKLFRESFSINGCTHSYCSDCICKYIVGKLQDNITQICCPVSGCLGLLEPEDCRAILPREVFDRWGKALCEAVILDSHKFYCPYKDCSAMLINDGGMPFALSNCQYCERYFCAQCNVPWHLGMDCREFQNLSQDERGAEDVMLMQLAKNNKWIRCPRCRFYVEKSSGCLFIRCRCGFSFCYNCGTPLLSHHCPTCN
ncbi:E3 ubiquitin-protein ligase RSL1-like [Apium graveolens]|uniref:E3 ubiquitin-protein ligase RSL1-like n=1 Tax=Apium graveolens TaxID=4045 RepID=UPI003D7A55B1